MKNVKNTNKFIQIIKIVLIAMVFIAFLPFITLAQSYPDFSYDYPDVSYDYPDVSYNYPDISYYYPNTYTTVTSGGYYGGGNSGGNYYYPGSSIVTSGSFSEGTTQIAPPFVYQQATSTVTTGSFLGGISSSTATYYVSPPSTVTSGGFSEVSPIYSYIQPTTYYSYYNQPTAQIIPNQVLAYTDVSPTLALDSVYLSDIPSTGFEDYAGTIIFISILVSWSSILAYIFLKRKIESQEIFANAYATKTEKNDIKDFITSNFTNQIISDNADISKVEEYARMNKILLSSDALIKLIKLSRLGQINVFEYIRGVAIGEWKSIGENQIK